MLVIVGWGFLLCTGSKECASLRVLNRLPTLQCEIVPRKDGSGFIIGFALGELCVLPGSIPFRTCQQASFRTDFGPTVPRLAWLVALGQQFDLLHFFKRVAGALLASAAVSLAVNSDASVASDCMRSNQILFVSWTFAILAPMLLVWTVRGGGSTKPRVRSRRAPAPR